MEKKYLFEIELINSVKLENGNHRTVVGQIAADSFAHAVEYAKSLLDEYECDLIVKVEQTATIRVI